MKIPKLEGFAYFCLRAGALLIGGATVIYFVCDNSVSNNEHSFMGPISKDSPLERLIKWKRKYGVSLQRLVLTFDFYDFHRLFSINGRKRKISILLLVKVKSKKFERKIKISRTDFEEKVSLTLSIS